MSAVMKEQIYMYTMTFKYPNCMDIGDAKLKARYQSNNYKQTTVTTDCVIV